MHEMVEAFAATPWILVVVFVVAALDAVVPLSPSESTLIAVAVVSAQTGRPAVWLVIVAAAGGAFVGDVVSFRIGVTAGAGSCGGCSSRSGVSRCTGGPAAPSSTAAGRSSCSRGTCPAAGRPRPWPRGLWVTRRGVSRRGPPSV